MFGGGKVKFERALWEKVTAYAQAAGYASPEELVVHAVEKEIAAIESADIDDDVRRRLRGLGYID